MITIDNYFEAIDKISFSDAPEALFKGHEFLMEATDDGKDLITYQGDEQIKKTIELYLSKLYKFILESEETNENSSVKPTEQTGKKRGSPKKDKQEVEKEDNDDRHYQDMKKMSIEKLRSEYRNMEEGEEEEAEDDEKDRLNYKVALWREINRRLPKSDSSKLYSQEIPPETEYDEWRIEFRDISKMNENDLEKEWHNTIDVENYNGLNEKEMKYQARIQKMLDAFASKKSSQKLKLVERIPEELKFIRRLVNMDGKSKTKDELLRFINSLQKSIVEKRIRKTSKLAKEIMVIQTFLIDTYNSMGKEIEIQLKQETKEQFRQLIGKEKVFPSINFIKRYFGLNGKTGVKEKANNLLEQINRAMEKGSISDDDPYISQINEIRKNLKAFTSSGKEERTLRIEQAELNGLQGILGCACTHVGGLGAIPSVMNSMDFAKLEFDTIGFTGKWRKLIGDPSRNFTAMVFGKPKFGKSYLCVEFAGYLARNHGKVLYVAKEEGLDYTLQEKLRSKDVAHPNLFVASEIPVTLAQYDFIFLDSVNKLDLKPEDLNRLKAANPAKSFVFIFQATKDGRFRGANTFQHDVDVVIEVPEKGKAVQMGRFNQGGEMDIFSSRQAA